MAKLKAAVIGTGGISNEHIMAYQKNENVELYAFCDINEKQLNLMAEKYGVPLLGQIPLVQGIRECGDEGIPAAVSAGPIFDAFVEIAKAL